MQQKINIENIKDFISAEMGISVIDIEEIKGGRNNNIFRVSFTDAQSIVAKIYYVDDRQRLAREFESLKLLNEKGFRNVPKKAHFSNDSMSLAVYSYEAGFIKPDLEFTRADIAQVIDFIVSLQEISPENTNAKIRPAVLACISMRDYIRNINERLSAFLAASSLSEAPEQLLDFAHSLPFEKTIHYACCNVIGEFD